MLSVLRIVISPNSFKGSLPAPQAAAAIAQGLEDSKLTASCLLLPIADGGDHTMEVMLASLKGYGRYEVDTEDALGRPIKAEYAYNNVEKRALVELSRTSGMANLPTQELNPLAASTYGTGLLIKEAIRRGARHITLAVGGSASVDGGTGVLKALGFQFLDERGEDVPDGGRGLQHIETIRPAASLPSDLAIEILCDVDNELMGKQGAAPVFAPQKGASPSDVRELEAGLKHYSYMIQRTTGISVSQVPHGGAAGGVAAGLHGLLGAQLHPGAKRVMEIIQLEDALRQADWLITAEGRLDSQTLRGKAPGVAATLAGKHNVPVITLAGSVDKDSLQSLERAFSAIFPIGNNHLSLEAAKAATEADLYRTAYQLGNLLFHSQRISHE